MPRVASLTGYALREGENLHVSDAVEDDAGRNERGDEGPSAFARLTRLGKYDIIARLGQGGMATVYLAVARGAIEDVRKLVVLKILHESFRDQHQYVEMFLREAKIAVDLSHANVVHTYNVGEEDGRYCIVMEYLEGVPLSELLKAASDWSIEERLPLLGAMCIVLGGLHYVHNLRDIDGNPLDLVHRDLKPANIMIGFDGQTKLLDFGVAKMTAPQLEQTEGLSVKGTVQYVAPEALDPKVSIDRRYDVFAAGLVLYEIATGRRLWADRDHLQILRVLGTDAIDEILDEGPELPPALAQPIRRALRASPDDRQATALQLKREVQAFLVAEGFRIDTDQLASLVQQEFSELRTKRRATISHSLKQLKVKKAATSPRPDTSMEAIDNLVQELGVSGDHSASSESHTSVPLAASSQTAPYGANDSETKVAPVPMTANRRPALVALLIVPLLLVGGYFVWQGGRQQDAPTAAKLSSAAVVPEGEDKVGPQSARSDPEPPRAGQVEVVVTVTPPGAQVLVDGTVVDGDPAVVRGEAGGEARTVQVRAAGHVEQLLEVALDHNRTINVALTPTDDDDAATPKREKKARVRRRRPAAATPKPEPEPEPARPSVSPAPDRPSAPRPGDELPTGKKRTPKSSIDSSIPWN